jgi:hypothetical protein
MLQYIESRSIVRWRLVNISDMNVQATGIIVARVSDASPPATKCWATMGYLQSQH